MSEFRIETLIAATIEDCFDLSISVDAHVASMENSGERAVGCVTSGRMGLGDTVTWRARHFGIAFRMTSAITALDFPNRFVDEQQSGPFGRWWHEHRFTRADHHTRMTDTVRFASPLGVLGLVADRLVLDSYLKKLIRQRNDWLKRTLEAGE